MPQLKDQHCQPCHGDVAPLSTQAATQRLEQVASGWELADDATTLTRAFKFKGFYKTMAFVNAIAWVANQEGHHPDMAVGYGYCTVTFTTHAIDGLSDNDFICAAKIDALLNDD